MLENIKNSRWFIALEVVLAVSALCALLVGLATFLLAERSIQAHRGKVTVCSYAYAPLMSNQPTAVDAVRLGQFLSGKEGEIVYLSLSIAANCIYDSQANDVTSSITIPDDESWKYAAGAEQAVSSFERTASEDDLAAVSDLVFWGTYRGSYARDRQGRGLFLIEFHAGDAYPFHVVAPDSDSVDTYGMTSFTLAIEEDLFRGSSVSRLFVENPYGDYLLEGAFRVRSTLYESTIDFSLEPVGLLEVSPGALSCTEAIIHGNDPYEEPDLFSRLGTYVTGCLF